MLEVERVLVTTSGLDRLDVVCAKLRADWKILARFSTFYDIAEKDFR